MSVNKIAAKRRVTPGHVIHSQYDGEWSFTYVQDGWEITDEDLSHRTYQSAVLAKAAMRETVEELNRMHPV